MECQSGSYRGTKKSSQNMESPQMRLPPSMNSISTLGGPSTLLQRMYAGDQSSLSLSRNRALNSPTLLINARRVGPRPINWSNHLVKRRNVRLPGSRGVVPVQLGCRKVDRLGIVRTFPTSRGVPLYLTPGLKKPVYLSEKYRLQTLIQSNLKNFVVRWSWTTTRPWTQL